MSGDDIIDAEWEEVPEPGSSHAATGSGHRSELHRVATASPLTQDDDVSPWRSRAFWYDSARAVVIGSRRITLTVIGIVAVGFLVMVWTGAIDLTEPENSAGAPSPQAGVQQHAQQMLRSWTELVTGQTDTSGFAMINGSGDPGDFCNNASGDTLLRFGGMTVGEDAAVPIFDFFAKFHGQTDSGVTGAFWYNAAEGTLLTRNTAEISNTGEKGESVADAVHTFEASGKGWATIDGTAYHVCTL